MLWYLIKIKMKSRLQYGRALLYDILSGILIFLLDTIPLLIILSNFTVGNWSKYEILFLYSLSRVGRVFGDLLFWIPMFGMDYTIKEGRFERYLLAPINSFTYFIGNQFTTFTLGHCLGSVIVAIISFNYIDVNIKLINLCGFAFAFFGGALIYAGILIFLGSISFWTLDSSGVSQMFSDITRFTNYPLTIYPKGFQFIFTFIVPIGITTYYPTIILLGKQDYSLYVSLFITLIGTVIFRLASKFWWRGIKTYQGTGS